jgi:hypothetical protein
MVRRESSNEKATVPFEQAQACPRCEQPGEVTSTVNIADGKKQATIYCRNKRCRWLNTCWLVTINADGTVPAPQDHTGAHKIYQGFEEHDRMASQIQEAIERDDRIAKLGGEVKRRG